MRDPEATLHLGESQVVRSLVSPAGPEHFLRSALAQALVQQRKLIAFELQDAQTAVAPRLRFLSQPSEWCDAQLFDAAVLTLDLQDQATAAGYDLKDASAWNILFAGTAPVFCDLLSFQPLQADKWWAAGQFARHFVVPLWLAQRRGMHGHASFTCWRDGVAPQDARRLLGVSRFMHRCWPLVADAPGASGGGAAPTSVPAQPMAPQDQRIFRQRLSASLRWMLAGVRPPAAQQGEPDRWSGYTSARPHYPADSLGAKTAQVAAWLTRLAPPWVADLGCNTGEFTAIALAASANVVSVDSDHDCITQLYRAHPDQARLHPLVATIDDLHGGRGWAGAEQRGLPDRLRGAFDLVMMLALLHHLAIGASVPLSEVARFAMACTRRWLIVEWIHEDDPQMALLAQQRGRDAQAFSLQRQRQAFIDAGFVIESELALAPAARTLALLHRPA